jgi:hypothetical protein
MALATKLTFYAGRPAGHGGSELKSTSPGDNRVQGRTEERRSWPPELPLEA